MEHKDVKLILLLYRKSIALPTFERFHRVSQKWRYYSKLCLSVKQIF